MTELLKAIRARQAKQTEFGHGILTADRHVANMKDLNVDRFDEALASAKSKLVYANEDMRVEKGSLEGELPKNTLMVFRHVLTTPRKDRDGDILRTDGALVDPNLLLLWQHVHTMPIGKMLSIAEHTRDKLSLVSAIVDTNELAHDAATMVDAGMARFSHGFRALKFKELDDKSGGFDIESYEIMEASMVSVPANTDAQVEEQMLDLIEGKRLTSSVMKNYGKLLREKRKK